MLCTAAVGIFVCVKGSMKDYGHPDPSIYSNHVSELDEMPKKSGYNSRGGGEAHRDPEDSIFLIATATSYSTIQSSLPQFHITSS